MNSSVLKDEYLYWLYGVVYDKKTLNNKVYSKLFRHLNNIDFYYKIPMDGNRAEDGIDLRYRFGCEKNIVPSVISTLLDIRPCSVLEMMVALAVRCEIHIMGDPDIGDLTYKWFWIMIKNLGLNSMSDDNYDGNYVDNVIHILLERKYERNGKGGLFIIENIDDDLRNMEIWYQLHYYLNENYSTEV